SDMEFSDNGVTHSIIGLSDGNLTADELDKVTDEEISEISQDMYFSHSEVRQISSCGQPKKTPTPPITPPPHLSLAVLCLLKSRLIMSSQKVTMGPSSIRNNLHTSSAHVHCPLGCCGRN
ncbi:hypothetical protein PAXRUDRAFT_795397, partial [Paxillus rubicundulus Ve08.2h10]